MREATKLQPVEDHSTGDVTTNADTEALLIPRSVRWSGWVQQLVGRVGLTMSISDVRVSDDEVASGKDRVCLQWTELRLHLRRHNLVLTAKTYR